MSNVPEKRRAEPLFPLVGFRDPDIDSGPPAPMVPRRIVRAWQSLRRAWRPWWTALAVAIVITAAVTIRLPLQVVSSTHLVDAATLVKVENNGSDAQASGHTGAYLTPATQRATIATAAIGVLHPGRQITSMPATVIQGYDAIDTALLSGAGMAPYLGSAADFGLRASFPRGGRDVHDLGVLLEIHDQVSSLDLAAGRRILVLATLRSDGTAVCTPGAQQAVNTAGEVDVILVAPDCADDIKPGGAELVEAPGFPDALVVLSEGR